MDNLPLPRNGRDLAARRRGLGISQQALAEAIGIHRVTLYEWETEPALDVIRSARYERALVALAAQKGVAA